MVLIYFLVSYMTACNYRDSKCQRNLQPAIYNQRRVLQRPMPVVEVQRVAEAINDGENVRHMQQDDGFVIDFDEAAAGDENHTGMEIQHVAEAINDGDNVRHVQQDDGFVSGVNEAVAVGENHAESPDSIQVGAVGLGNRRKPKHH